MSSRCQRTIPTVLLTGLLGATGPAQILPEPARRIVTPDGSVFVLVPRPGRSVVWWASHVRMGAAHEPQGQQGLAESCIRASLNGTRSHGTRDADAEDRALAALEAARRALHNAVAAGLPEDEVSKRRKARAAALEAARQLGDPHEFRRLLAELPSATPEIRTGVRGTLLITAVPARLLPDFAVLMESRRHDAVLRGFHETFSRVRRELAERAEAPGTTHLRQACLLALALHPARRCLVRPSESTPFVGRAEALRFYRRHVRPERSVTAVVGAFDVDALADALHRVFVRPPDETRPAPVPLPVEPDPAGKRSTEVAAAGGARLTLAWRTPSGASLDQLEVLAELVAGRGAALSTPLVDEKGLAMSVRARPAFPDLGDPALFVVEVTARDDSTFEELATQTDAWFRGLGAEGGLDAGAVALAVRRWTAGRRYLLADNRALAVDLASRFGLTKGRDVKEPRHGVDDLTNLAESLFDPSRLTRVRSELRGKAAR